MAPNLIKKALKEMMYKLSEEKFDRFRDELKDREGEPRVYLNSVENKTRLQIVDVLVSTFTEAGAVEVAKELLDEMSCYTEKNALVAATRGLLAASGSNNDAGPSARAAAVNTKAEEEHFVEKHRKALIDKVCNIKTILDDLLQEKVISQGVYSAIMAIPTNDDKMRKLYEGYVTNSRKSKDIFLKVLEENEKFLIDELKGK